jgi:hypothetical protein
VLLIYSYFIQVMEVLGEKEKMLPKIWYIQADNCAKEIKCTAVLTFLSLLVQVSVFFTALLLLLMLL